MKKVAAAAVLALATVLAAVFSLSAQADVLLSENFDGVVAPALPVGWSTTVGGSGALPWVTSTTTPSSAPNSAFVAGASDATESHLYSPLIDLAGATDITLTFGNYFDLEESAFASFDGGVLEVSIDGGAIWVDIVTVAQFTSGGYTDTISNVTGNSLGNRQAWSGDSGGYITTTVEFPDSLEGEMLQLRWRLGTDLSVSSDGWRIDDVVVTATIAAVPEPATLALLGIGLAGLAFSRRKRNV